MKRKSGCECSAKTGIGRSCGSLWKRIALVVMVLSLLLGLMGCAMDDLLFPFVGDIPFEQEPTAPSDMGAVDNAPIIPDADAPLGEIDFLPFD